MNPLQQLGELQQSVWLDTIDHGLLASGRLARLIAEDRVVGVTTNPAIFNKAFAGVAAYREAIASLWQQCDDAVKVYEALAIKDVQQAADVLADQYESSNGLDGYVSLEVSPRLARDTEGTIAEGQRLWAEVDRPNLMIKVPGTEEATAAIEALISGGINVNVTLLFCRDACARVRKAFLAGLEQRVSRGQAIDRVASVASFFLSRIDTAVDDRVDASLQGGAAVAVAKLAYADFQASLKTERWTKLAARGARPQRPLWASTGTKNPAYSDVKYVEELIGPHTVTTLPMATLEAFRDHGRTVPTLTEEVAAAQAHLGRLAEAGVDMDEIARQLQDNGIQLFIEPFEALLKTLNAQRPEATASGSAAQ